MTVGRLVARNLMRHPIRVALTLLFSLLALFLFAFLRSIVTTLDSAVSGAATDRVAVQSATSLYVALPIAYREKIAAIPGVESVQPWTWFGGLYRDRSGFFAQFGCDLEVLLHQYPEIEIVAGDRDALLHDRNGKGCLIGRGLANKWGWKVGDTVPLMGTIYALEKNQAWEFTVQAIYASHRPNIDEKTMFFHWDHLFETAKTLRAYSGKGQLVSVYMVKVTKGTPPEEVIDAIDDKFSGGPQKTRTMTEAQFQAQFVSMLGSVPTLLSWIGGAVMFAILFSVVNTMGIAARERARDVGILKALGFRDAVPGRLLLLESMAVVGTGGLLGLGLAFLSVPMFRDLFGMNLPNYHVRPETAVVGAAIALAIGFLGGILPAVRMRMASAVAILREEA
jgi:putative ABC transport system permease protein